MALIATLKDTQWAQISTYVYNAETQSMSEALADEMSKNGRVAKAHSPSRAGFWTTG